MAQRAEAPVESGWVASLARPGGNVTGLLFMDAGLSAKRVQLLRELLPGLSHGAALWNSKHELGRRLLKETEDAARALGIEIQSFEVTDGEHLEGAFRLAAERGARAVLLIQDPLFWQEMRRVAQLALKYRLPTISGETGFAQAGGLMTYGPDPIGNWHRVATYLDGALMAS